MAVKIEHVLKEIRKVIKKFDGPEKVLYEELLAESDKWAERLAEIEDKEEDGED